MMELLTNAEMNEADRLTIGDGVADCCCGEPLGAVHVKGKGELQMVRFVDFTA